MQKRPAGDAFAGGPSRWRMEGSGLVGRSPRRRSRHRPSALRPVSGSASAVGDSARLGLGRCRISGAVDLGRSGFGRGVGVGRVRATSSATPAVASATRRQPPRSRAATSSATSAAASGASAARQSSPRRVRLRRSRPRRSPPPSRPSRRSPRWPRRSVRGGGGRLDLVGPGTRLVGAGSGRGLVGRHLLADLGEGGRERVVDPALGLLDRVGHGVPAFAAAIPALAAVLPLARLGTVRRAPAVPVERAPPRPA